MKSTIKAEGGRALCVEPSTTPGNVKFTALMFGVKFGELDATPDQCGALIFGIEQALEVGQVRAGVRCHNADACQLGQVECPTKAACGVAL